MESVRLLITKEMTSFTEGNTNLTGDGRSAESRSLFTVFSNEDGSTKEGLVRELGLGSLGFFLRGKLDNTATLGLTSRGGEDFREYYFTTTSLHEVGKILVIAIIRQVTHIQPVLSLADLGVSLGLGSRRIHRPTDTLLPVLSGRTIPT